MRHKSSPHALAALAGAGVLLLGATSALAHAHLVNSSPAANATLTASPKSIVLTFNEKLTPAFSTVQLSMVDHNMKVPVKTAVSKDGKSLVATPQAALMKGAYKVTWAVASSDGHKMTGDVTFRIG
jgi:methionine-rich copper-binding protein CopC